MFNLFDSSSSDSQEEYLFMFVLENKKRKIIARVKEFVTQMVDNYSEKEVSFVKVCYSNIG